MSNTSPQVEIDVMCAEAQNLLTIAKDIADARSNLKQLLVEVENYKEYIVGLTRTFESTAGTLSSLATKVKP